MTEFEKPFPDWVKYLAACVVCLWLALVGWVWKNPGWVWGGGRLYFRCCHTHFCGGASGGSVCALPFTLPRRKRLDPDKKKL